MTTPVSSATASSAPASSPLAADSAKDAADRFLTLLVSQLKNQDPLNPLDNAQITSQLAQISTVSGIDKLNSTMSSLAASFDAKQYLQSAALLGREVLVQADNLNLADAAAAGSVGLADAATRVTVTIANAAGTPVRTLELGKQAGGIVSYAWDGKDNQGVTLKDGAYKVSVEAAYNGDAVQATSLALAKVTSVVPGANGGSLNLEGLGRYDLSAVIQIN